MRTPFALESLLRRWTPAAEDDSAADAFRGLYADPVTVNSATLTAAWRTSSACTEPCRDHVSMTSRRRRRRAALAVRPPEPAGAPPGALPLR
jgi:hypothetical protein